MSDTTPVKTIALELSDADIEKLNGFIEILHTADQLPRVEIANFLKRVLESYHSSQDLLSREQQGEIAFTTIPRTEPWMEQPLPPILQPSKSVRLVVPIGQFVPQESHPEKLNKLQDLINLIHSQAPIEDDPEMDHMQNLIDLVSSQQSEELHAPTILLGDPFRPDEDEEEQLDNESQQMQSLLDLIAADQSPELHEPILLEGDPLRPYEEEEEEEETAEDQNQQMRDLLQQIASDQSPEIHTPILLEGDPLRPYQQEEEEVLSGQNEMEQMKSLLELISSQQSPEMHTPILFEEDPLMPQEEEPKPDMQQMQNLLNLVSSTQSPELHAPILLGEDPLGPESEDMDDMQAIFDLLQSQQPPQSIPEPKEKEEPMPPKEPHSKSFNIPIRYKKNVNVLE